MAYDVSLAGPRRMEYSDGYRLLAHVGGVSPPDEIPAGIGHNYGLESVTNAQRMRTTDEGRWGCPDGNRL